MKGSKKLHWLGSIVLFLLLMGNNANANELIWRGALVASIVSYALSNPFSADSVGIDLGTHAERDISTFKLRTTWKYKDGLLQTPNYQLGVDFGLNLGYWHLGMFSDEGKNFDRYQRVNNILDFTMHFKHRLKGWRTYLMTETGMYVASTKQMGDIKYGSSIGFVNGIGVHHPVTKTQRYSFFYLHYSNNDTAQDNPPDNLLGMGLTLYK